MKETEKLLNEIEELAKDLEQEIELRKKKITKRLYVVGFILWVLMLVFTFIILY